MYIDRTDTLIMNVHRVSSLLDVGSIRRFGIKGD